MRLVLVATLMVGLLVALGCGSTRMPVGSQPAEGRPPAAPLRARWPSWILWAWQRPEDLSFIDPQRVGVSYLVKTIQLKGQSVFVQPNTNGLKVPAGTWVMACARIETDTASPPNLSPQQVGETTSALASLAEFPDARAAQIDFDATASQRDFYRNLLTELRRRLPRQYPLSITALGSWCVGDDWIAHLPIDEAVPMLFRMGPDRTSIMLRLQDGEDFEEPLCRQSVGISTDELVPHLSGRRLYIFNPDTWTRATFNKVVIIKE
jgi:hypothetical protein